MKLKFNLLIICFAFGLFFNMANAQYCSSSFHNPSQHYISNVNVGTLNNTTTYGASSYSDYTSISTDLTIGNTYTITISSARVDSWRAAGYGIWIDYNGDGDFYDANEEVWSFGTSTVSPQSTSFSVPGNAITGATRMRVSMVNWYTPDPCAVDTNTNNYGEIEDYTINILPPVNPVPADDDLLVTQNSNTGANNQIDVSLNDNIGTDGGDSDNFSLNTTASNGTVTEVSDGVFEYVPNANFFGTDSFTYSICDALNHCATATVNVIVNWAACKPTSNSKGDRYITNVSLVGESTSINNTSGDDGGYANYTDGTAADLYLGSSYNVTVSTGGDTNTAGWAAYIDFNQNGNFNDPGEKIYDTQGTEAYSPFASQNFTVPFSASLGFTVMRIGVRRYYSSGESCGTTSGQAEEFEDYKLNLSINPTSPAEIDIKGNGNNITDGSTTTYVNNNTDFGVYDIYSTIPSQKTYRITNNGGTDLILIGGSPVTLTGSSDFSISSQPTSTTLASGEFTFFSIEFSPTAPIIGQRIATVSIANNDPDENPYTFTIEGYGEQTFPDTDGDGIPDNVDLDDDNDGLPDQYEQVSCVSNPIANTTDVVFLFEDFETGTNRGTIDGVTYCWEDGSGSCNSSPDLNDGEYVVYYKATNNDGTNQTPNGEVASWADGLWYPGLDHTPNDTNGRMAMFNADYDPGIFYEKTIVGVSAGVDITYGFSAINLDRANAPGIATRERPSVLIEILDPTGTVITSSSTGLIAPTTDYVTGDWVDVSATFNTQYTQFTVRLINQSPGGLGNDLAIDDIFVQQTLCDLDGDGVEDAIDLDNDNDGIPNVVELQLPDTDKDATVNNDTGANTWVDINNNGLLDLYDHQDAAGNNPGDVGFTSSVGVPIDLTDPKYDTDGDGVTDYLDLDSDNDGIFDAVEYDNRGDIDINGDGNGDGLDRQLYDSNGIAIPDDGFDGDGILSPADGNDLDADDNDHGTNNAYPTPLDDDGDGIPNFRDVDSGDNPNNFANGSDIDTTEIYAHLDADNDGVLDDTIDTDNDGILDIFDTDNTIYGSPRALNDSYTLFFDGRNDYVEEPPVINGWTNATLMSWVKVEPGSSGKRVIAGQDEIQLYITASGNASASANGNTLTSSAAIATGIWVHVAAIYNGTTGNFTLYINGEEDGTTTVSGALPADTSNFTLGRTPDTDSDYFEGELDEVRVFTKALTKTELERMVYQELITAQRGAVIPLDISTTLAGTLSRYYKMDTYTDDITGNNASGAKLYNIKNIYFQTAPLPYETIAGGSGHWSNKNNWKHGDVWDIDDEANNKDWSIVHLKHSIETANRHGTSGLLIDASADLEVNGDSELLNTWYLNLDGDIDLQGESQLVQTETSILTATSNGTLERDQQGNSNTYLYNYWSSPVGTPNNSTNNNSYTLPNVISNVLFSSSGFNGSDSPVTNADYWIWKYANRLGDTYSEWQHIRSTGTMLTGEGFSMKGPGTATPEQNYVFKGKPNNGDITLTIAAGNDYLIGNPYPSAMDANEFIYDNISTTDGGRNTTGNVINGALYFWDHFAKDTHILREYEGGYATYTLMGAAPAISTDTRITASGQTGTKTPGQYIPVGQGFFVSAIADASLPNASSMTQPIDGGTIVIKNSQRIFKTEASDPSLFLKSNSKKTKTASTKANTDIREKIRLKFNSPKGYHRQLLVGVDSLATKNYDLGYEALLNEENSEDMYWMLNDSQLIIQAVNNFDKTQTLPLGVKTKEGGFIEIEIDELENILDETEIYLKDNLNNVYHNLKTSKYITSVASNEVHDRFEIVFSENNELSNTDIKLNTDIAIYYNNTLKTIEISNEKNHDIKSIEVINMLGQKLLNKAINSSKSKISTPANINSGAYIFKIKTLNSTINKKSLIN
ncbi:hypothetical protein GCM10022291_17180 [Postechiella marina]|uniref:LamG-like jellyroll fold domain-containing protein n=1 Tax=Postechiella marina TaxID=943941 RepID=A0ABP8C887_9FLAO